MSHSITNWASRALCILLLSFAPLVQAADPSFPTVKMETLDEEKFVFPEDLDGTRANIVLLAMSDEQDNGTWQGDALVEWYAKLDARGNPVSGCQSLAFLGPEGTVSL